MKKVPSIVGIAVSLILITSIPSVISEKETISAKTNLIALGYIHINEEKGFINGFVIAGINGGQVLSFEFIHIPYDGGMIFFFKPLPLVWWLQYTPVT